MQRAGLVAILVGVGVIGTGLLRPLPAWADCADDLAALRPRLAEIQDQKRREEARLILEKAAIEERHGRSALCQAALESASKLLN